jgi:hypothetical protein
MSTVFNSDVHKQQYDEGVMAEMRDSIPMNSVSKVRNDNVEYIFNRYGDDESANNTTDGVYTTTTATYNSDSKLIDKEAVRSNNIRYKDMAREGFDVALDLADRHGFALAEAIHRNAAKVAYALANGIVDNEVLAGSASALTPITLSTSNPDEVGATITQVLQEREAYGMGTPFMMMSPKAAKNFNLYSMGAGFEVADSSIRSGLFQVNRGSLFGLDTIVTNEVPRSVRLTYSGNVTANDTLTVGGVVFTIVASPAAAGDVDLGADAATTIVNLAAAINAASGQGATSGAGTLYVLPSSANQLILKNAGVTATATSATVLTIETMRYVTISESMGNCTIGTYTENILAGIRNAVEIVTPSNGYHSDEKSIATTSGGFNGVQLTNTQVHDAHVFFKNRDKLVRVLVGA